MNFFIVDTKFFDLGKKGGTEKSSPFSEKEESNVLAGDRTIIITVLLNHISMLKKITKTIENILNLFPFFFGNISSWLILLMIFLSSMIVILRYVFEIGVVAMQELLVYSHGMLFLFYAALALKDDAHVRVDIFYRELSDKRKRMVNIFGNLFFLQPFAWVILIFSFEYVYFAWSINEISPEPGGLPFVYLFKTSLIIFPVLLILQSFSELIKLVFKND